MFALLYAASQLLNNFKLLVIMTFKSYSSLLDDKLWPLISYWNFWLLLPICKTLHLDVLNSICHFWTNLLMTLGRAEDTINHVFCIWMLKDFIRGGRGWSHRFTNVSRKVTFSKRCLQERRCHYFVRTMTRPTTRVAATAVGRSLDLHTAAV